VRVSRAEDNRDVGRLRCGDRIGHGLRRLESNVDAARLKCRSFPSTCAIFVPSLSW
jgi:hypothetical protein